MYGFPTTYVKFAQNAVIILLNRIKSERYSYIGWDMYTECTTDKY